MSPDLKRYGRKAVSARPASEDTGGDRPVSVAPQDGMTLREAASIAAMEGMLANPVLQETRGKRLARAAIAQAEHLLAELLK